MDYDIGEIHDRHSGAKLTTDAVTAPQTTARGCTVYMFRTLMKYQRHHSAAATL